MKLFSLNIKEIIDPIKFKALKAWIMENHKDVDSIYVQEVNIHSSLSIWKQSSKQVTLLDYVLMDPNQSLWVGYKIGVLYSFNMMLIYVSGSTKDIIILWKVLKLS